MFPILDVGFEGLKIKIKKCAIKWDDIFVKYVKIYSFYLYYIYIIIVYNRYMFYI